MRYTARVRLVSHCMPGAMTLDRSSAVRSAHSFYPHQADGKFHEGDCYILLATTETPGRLDQAVHFWLGSECSQARFHPERE